MITSNDEREEVVQEIQDEMIDVLEPYQGDISLGVVAEAVSGLLHTLNQTANDEMIKDREVERSGSE